MSGEAKDKKVPAAAEIPKKIDLVLSDGAKCVVIKGKGKTAMAAQRLVQSRKSTNGSTKDVTSNYNLACMSLLTTINGAGQTMESLEELDMDDFHDIQTAFFTINFR